MRRGEARVCVGPRSAVFPPFGEPGLRVVDRSTTRPTSRKADPGYDARVRAEPRPARRRRCFSGSPLHGPRARRYERLGLDNGWTGGLPPVEVVGTPGAPAPPRTHPDALDEVQPWRREGDRVDHPGWSNFSRPGLRERGNARPRRTPDPPGTGESPATTAGTASRTSGLCGVRLGPWPATEADEQLERELEDLMAPLPVFRLTPT